MKIQHWIITLIVSLALNGVYAQPHIHGKNITKIAEGKDLKIVVDIMDHKAHERMMKAMKMKMKHPHKMHKHKKSHHIMITLIDKHSGKMIQKASLIAKLITPSKKKIQLDLHEMHGKNMHHWGAHLNLKEKGKYTLSIKVKHKNHSLNKNISFTL